MRITLVADGHRLDLSIVNDLDSAASTTSQDARVPALGFGLRGLADRAAERGGAMRVRREGDEFTLKVSVPLAVPARERRRVTA